MPRPSESFRRPFVLFRIIRKRIFPKYRYKREKIQYEYGDGQKRGDGDEKYRVHVHQESARDGSHKEQGDGNAAEFRVVELGKAAVPQTGGQPHHHHAAHHAAEGNQV